MSNIFENAYFGKPYKTRNDYKALFIRHYKDSESDDMYYLIVENAAVTYVYNKNGEIAPSYKNKGLDIISEWDEEIDEEELNKMAIEECDKILKDEIFSCNDAECVVLSDAEKCWKLGYCQGIKK